MVAPLLWDQETRILYRPWLKGCKLMMAVNFLIRDKILEQLCDAGKLADFHGTLYPCTKSDDDSLQFLLSRLQLPAGIREKKMEGRTFQRSVPPLIISL
jgi:hypothetical protein